MDQQVEPPRLHPTNTMWMLASLAQQSAAHQQASIGQDLPCKSTPAVQPHERWPTIGQPQRSDSATTSDHGGLCHVPQPPKQVWLPTKHASHKNTLVTPAYMHVTAGIALYWTAIMSWQCSCCKRNEENSHCGSCHVVAYRLVFPITHADTCGQAP